MAKKSTKDKINWEKIATYLHQLQSEQDLAQMADITEV